MKHIPFSLHPKIKEMFLEQGMTKQEIAAAIGTRFCSVVAALRQMDCRLSDRQIDDRRRANIERYNRVRRRKAEEVKVKPAPPYTIIDLIKAAKFVTGQPVDEICGRCRWKHLINIRNAIYYLGCEHYSMAYVGRKLDRDHTTVLHGRRNAMIAIEVNPHFRRLVEAIRYEAAKAKEAERRQIAASVEALAA